MRDELAKVFVSVMQKVITEKEIIFSGCCEVLDEILDTRKHDRMATRLLDQTLGRA